MDAEQWRDQQWREPPWLAGVAQWLDDRLETLGISRTGEHEQTHIYSWSTVLRIPTDRGPLWFKATTDALRHEVALTARIAKRRPDLVPPLLAADPVRGWLLMADAGERLREVTARERSLDRWHDVLSQYARLQLDLADDVADLLAAGVPDRRLATLPPAYERLVDGLAARTPAGDPMIARLREAVPLVGRLVIDLSSYGLPELLQHDDLHDGQVYARSDGHVILDWGDACVSHPFFTLAVTLDGVLSWGLDDVENSVDVTGFRDAYLEPFARRHSGDLVAAADLARRLGWVCRAVNGHVPGDDEKTFTRLRMFLDGRT